VAISKLVCAKVTQTKASIEPSQNSS